jgi:hypothetical protein
MVARALAIPVPVKLRIASGPELEILSRTFFLFPERTAASTVAAYAHLP